MTGQFVDGTGNHPRESTRSPEEQAAAVALLESGESQRTAAAIAGMPRETLRDMARDEPHKGRIPVPRAHRDLAREVLAERCDVLLGKYLDHLGMDTVIAGASARDSAVVVGILTDKSIKLRGEDKPDPLDRPLTVADYLLSLAAQAAAAKRTG